MMLNWIFWSLINGHYYWISTSDTCLHSSNCFRVHCSFSSSRLASQRDSFKESSVDSSIMVLYLGPTSPYKALVSLIIHFGLRDEPQFRKVFHFNTLYEFYRHKELGLRASWKTFMTTFWICEHISEQLFQGPLFLNLFQIDITKRLIQRVFHHGLISLYNFLVSLFLHFSLRDKQLERSHSSE